MLITNLISRYARLCKAAFSAGNGAKLNKSIQTNVMVNPFQPNDLMYPFYKERCKKTNHNGLSDTAYSNETIPDSIMLNARGAGAAITTLYPSHSTRKAYNTITYFGNIKWK